MIFKVDISDKDIEDLLIQLKFARSFLFNAMDLIPSANNKIANFHITNCGLEDKLRSILLYRSTEQHDSEDNK